jgi:hypothetical protein
MAAANYKYELAALSRPGQITTVRELILPDAAQSQVRLRLAYQIVERLDEEKTSHVGGYLFVEMSERR